MLRIIFKLLGYIPGGRQYFADLDELYWLIRYTIFPGRFSWQRRQPFWALMLLGACVSGAVIGSINPLRLAGFQLTLTVEWLWVAVAVIAYVVIGYVRRFFTVSAAEAKAEATGARGRVRYEGYVCGLLSATTVMVALIRLIVALFFR